MIKTIGADPSVMKVITCNFPAVMIAAIDKLVKKKWFPSRSEALRQLIMKGLPYVMEELRQLEFEVLNDSFSSIKDFFEDRGYRIQKYMKPTDSYKNCKIGNPFWEESVIDTTKVFINKEDPNKIMYMNEEGEMKEYNIKGES